nr:hypothetical protein [Legionella norrlandica]
MFYWITIILLMRDIKWRWSIALAILLFGMIYARDSLFFSYPLIVGLLIHKEVLSQKAADNYSSLLFALLFTPLGLLPLIKAHS